MIKIQTVVKISRLYPSGKSDEYIWMEPQPWPVPLEDEKNLLKIECFGNELQNERIKAIGGGEQMKNEQTGEVIYRFWYRTEASYVSEQMRVFYPPNA